MVSYMGNSIVSLMFGKIGNYFIHMGWFHWILVSVDCIALSIFLLQPSAIEISATMYI